MVTAGVVLLMGEGIYAAALCEMENYCEEYGAELINESAVDKKGSVMGQFSGQLPPELPAMLDSID